MAERSYLRLAVESLILVFLGLVLGVSLCAWLRTPDRREAVFPAELPPGVEVVPEGPPPPELRGKAPSVPGAAPLAGVSAESEFLEPAPPQVFAVEPGAGAPGQRFDETPWTELQPNWLLRPGDLKFDPWVDFRTVGAAVVASVGGKVSAQTPSGVVERTIEPHEFRQTNAYVRPGLLERPWQIELAAGVNTFSQLRFETRFYRQGARNGLYLEAAARMSPRRGREGFVDEERWAIGAGLTRRYGPR